VATLSCRREAVNKAATRTRQYFRATAFSSLSYLRRFPFDKIKIDQSFISEVDASVDAQAIVRAIIGMSQALKTQINAEGVQTVEQADILQKAGCEEVQGYLYGRPMRKRDVETLLTSTGAISLPSEEEQLLPSANAN
jgi:EAL domain-containing protein (putative c-di-GMP-specific phosphodiesterase class I)